MTRYSLALSRHLQGFALIEALVALSLMAFVLVSSSQLYSFIQQESQYAHQQLRAYQATEDLARRIQLNVTQWHAYAGTYTDIVSSPRSCIHHMCTPTELKYWDIEQWMIQLIHHIKLPQVQACIEAQAEKLTLNVTWLSHRSEILSDHKKTDQDMCSGFAMRKEGVRLRIIRER